MPAAFSDALRTARAQKIIDLINAGSGPGSMLFYTATQPAKGAAITTQTLLGTCPFAEPAGTIAAGVLTLAVMVDDSSADADGVATWVRVLDGDGAFIMDLAVTNNAGVGPVKMSSTTIYASGIIHVTSGVLTEGNG